MISVKHMHNFRRWALVSAFVILFEALLFPSLGGDIWDSMSKRDFADRGALTHILGVLKENKTGLGSLEELNLAQVILVESIAHRMDPLFVLALIKTESTCNNWSKSLKGAIGLMQILPSTGKELAAELKLKWNGDATLLNPYVNVRMGVHYLSNLKERFHDDTEISLAAYNAGPNYLASKIRLKEDVARDFIDKVLTNYEDLKERAVYY